MVEAATDDAHGRKLWIGDDQGRARRGSVAGNELWALSCGNGVVEEGEECDAGERNGSAGSGCRDCRRLAQGSGKPRRIGETSRLLPRIARAAFDGEAPGEVPSGPVEARLTVQRSYDLAGGVDACDARASALVCRPPD